MKCEKCAFYFSDRSTGAMECENKEITEQELIKYFTNDESGCSHFQEDNRTD